MHNLLLDHVGLPHVLVVAVHLVNPLGWMGEMDHSKTFLSEHSCLKVRGRVAQMKIVSAKGPNPSFFPFFGDFYLTLGSIGTGAWTQIWTKA